MNLSDFDQWQLGSVHPSFLFMFNITWLVVYLLLIMVNDDVYYILNDGYIVIIWLVVEPYPSEKWWSSSVGVMTMCIWSYHILASWRNYGTFQMHLNTLGFLQKLPNFMPCPTRHGLNITKGCGRKKQNAWYTVPMNLSDWRGESLAGKKSE